MTFWDRLGAVLGLRTETPASPPALTQAQQDRLIWTAPNRSARVGVVFTCIGIIATAVEQLSVDVEAGGLPTPDAPPLIRLPDPSLLSRSAWLHQVVASLALHGNAYLRVWRDGNHDPIVARVLPPALVTPWLDDRTGQPRFTYRGTDYTAWDIVHLRYLTIPGEVRGLGPIQAAQAELAGHIDLTAASTSWIRTSGVPAGILTTEQSLTREQRLDLLDTWNSIPAGRTRILSNGITYDSFAINPRDAQFLESRRFSKTEIADLFGIPASLMLGLDKGDSQTYANVAQDWLGFVRFRLMRYVREIEGALTHLLPAGQEARFNLEALLRSDALTRMDIHAAAIDAGIYSPDYARDIERIPPTAAPKERTP